MLAIYATVALAAVSSVSAAPLSKRIAQVISDSTAQWQTACLAAGGGQQCNPLSIKAFDTLLAAPGPCEQQDAADDMIDLAHQLNNDSEMIRLTQLFRQQPRNAVCASPKLLLFSSHSFSARQSFSAVLRNRSTKQRAEWSLPVPVSDG
jgi:hypothetical protein